jgi:hypothetical protein
MAKDQGGHRKLGDSISRPLRCSGFHVLSPQGPTDSPRGRDDSLANEELSFEGPVRSRAIALSKGSAASSAPFIPPITAIFLGLFAQILQVSLRHVKPCNKTCRTFLLENPLVEPGRERRMRRRPRDRLAASVRSVSLLPGMAWEFCADKALRRKGEDCSPPCPIHWFWCRDHR